MRIWNESKDIEVGEK